MDRTSLRRRMALGLGAGALLVATAAGSAQAADTVTQAITAGGLTASVANLALPSVPYQNAARDVTGTMTLTAEDTRGTGAGWKVTIQSSAFVYSGAATGPDIPAADFALTSAAAPVLVLGQPVDATAATGPQVPPTFAAGSLDTARQTIHATAAYGQGRYTQQLAVTLTIPAMSDVGTYTGTLTTTITSAP